MSTLLLRLAGPLQSWGIDSRFEIRRTEKIPSKSGVVGLIAAALGYSRDVQYEILSCLNELQFGVRTDREGMLLADDHFTKPIKVSKDKNNTSMLDKIRSGNVLYSAYTIPMETDPKKSIFAKRYYLSDAVFLVGLATEDDDYLRELENALRHPAYPLFLGRRSCPPTMPLCLGIRETGLIETLENEPRLTKDNTPMKIVTDALSGEQGTPIQDIPLSFSPLRREYGYRTVVDRGYISPRNHEKHPDETEHDIFAELEE